MPTIKDIAKLAGVSHGTVSNVLNKTGKVKIEKIKLVEKAVEALGYTPNAQAQVLRQGSKTLVVVVLPNLETTSYRDMFQVIQETFSEKKYEVMLFTTNGLQAKELETLPTLPLSQAMVIFFITSLFEFPKSFSPSSPVIFLNRMPKHNCKQAFDFSFDYEQAGKEISQQLLKKNPKTIAIIRRYADDVHNNPLLKSLFELTYTHDINCVDVASITNLLPNKAYDILNSDVPADIIFSLEQDDADLLYLMSLNKNHNPIILSLTSYKTFTKYNYETYSLNYKMFALDICNNILQHIENNKECNTVMRYPCKGDTVKNVFNKKKAKLRLLTVDNPSTEALSKIVSTYHIQTEVEVILSTVAYDDLYTLLAKGKAQKHDLIRLDLVGLQEFSKDVLLPLVPLSPSIPLILKSFIPDALRLHASVDNTVFALPFDPSSQILLYREDLFENAILKRQFYEMYHEPLLIPKDFIQFNKIAAFFTQSINAFSPTKYGTTSTHGTASVASCDFLPRLHFSGIEFLSQDGHFIIDTKAVLEALKGYLETNEYTSKKNTTWWKEAAEEFANGDVAMQINFSNFAGNIFRPSKSNVVGKVGIAPVPGNTPILGGGSIGISKHSANIEACIDFFKWFYQGEVACEFSYFGGLSPHKNVYENWDIMKSFPWNIELQRGLKNGLRGISNDPKSATISLRTFEHILGTAVKHAVTQKLSPEEALSFAQSQFDALTKNL